MRSILVSVLVVLGPLAQSTAPARTPVVVELFTSEGCSSCPPADRLLSAMGKEQPVPGVEIIPLSLHVDYWDQLGWKDPASSHDATLRQQAYTRSFGLDSVYTPEAVVDGTSDANGNDADTIRRAIQRAAREPHIRVAVEARAEGQSILVTSSADAPPATVKEPLSLVIALVEDDINSAVKRGENSGKSLHHDGVVRALRTVRPQAAGQQTTFALRAGWKPSNLRAVAFLQGEKSQRIWGAAATRLR
jgi:hypothetical protein